MTETPKPQRCFLCNLRSALRGVLPYRWSFSRGFDGVPLCKTCKALVDGKAKAVQ